MTLTLTDKQVSIMRDALSTIIETTDKKNSPKEAILFCEAVEELYAFIVQTASYKQHRTNSIVQTASYKEAGNE